MQSEQSTALQAIVQAAFQQRRPLAITGGKSKTFYGRTVKADALDVSHHRGIVTYEPTELVITARSGTPVKEIETTLAAENQMLAFEPPHFGETATLGGTIACNFSGPRRAYAGAARDFVLGTRLINGKGEIVKFGGEVMKNVAGYDIARLMTGAMGTLGVLLEVSLKVLPRPESERTIYFECTASDAIAHMHRWSQSSLPLSATYFDGQGLYVRLSGSEGALRAAHKHVGGESVSEADVFWQSVREHSAAFFAGTQPLWRLSIASDTPPQTIAGAQVFEWGGSLRWLKSAEEPAVIQALAHKAGGHATLFRRDDHRTSPFAPLPAPIQYLHQQLKQAFDPAGILNPGRMYPEF